MPRGFSLDGTSVNPAEYLSTCRLLFCCAAYLHFLHLHNRRSKWRKMQPFPPLSLSSPLYPQTLFPSSSPQILPLFSDSPPFWDSENLRNYFLRFFREKKWTKQEWQMLRTLARGWLLNKSPWISRFNAEAEYFTSLQDNQAIS